MVFVLPAIFAATPPKIHCVPGYRDTGVSDRHGTICQKDPTTCKQGQKIDEREAARIGSACSSSQRTLWNACEPSAVDVAVSRARTLQPNNASALANAFWSGCKTHDMSAWSAWDGHGYLYHNWQPTQACTAPRRFGPSEGLGVRSDGGKTVCDSDALLLDGHNEDTNPCLVVSVGLNSDTRFEQDLHSAYPKCRIHAYDGTLRPTQKALVPGFVNFFPVNFERSSAIQRYSGMNVALLKIDCEGCGAPTVICRAMPNPRAQVGEGAVVV